MSSRLLAIQTLLAKDEELGTQPLLTDLQMHSGHAGGVFETASLSYQTEEPSLSSSIRILRHSNTTSPKVLQ